MTFPTILLRCTQKKGGGSRLPFQMKYFIPVFFQFPAVRRSQYLTGSIMAFSCSFSASNRSCEVSCTIVYRLKSLKEASEGRTIALVSHGTSTVRIADEVVAM